MATAVAASGGAPHFELDPKYDHYDFPTTSPEVRNGHPGHTTKEEDAKVFQLRSKLEQEGYKDRLDTLSMLRFLRARKFNVEASHKMFVDCEAWRKTFGNGTGVDNLTRNFEYKEKPEMMKYYPQYYHKTDKDGRPVYIEQLGHVDLTAMNKISSQDRMLQNLVVEYEKVSDPRLPACSRKAGQLLETCCTIMDLKGVGLSKASQCYGYVQAASGISQNYYPERLGKLYVINAPWGFGAIFSVVKGFLDPVTVNKIHVLGGGYKKELLEQIPAENLPENLGGTCKCAGGCEFSDEGPWKNPEFARPAWWEKAPGEAAADTSIENKPSGPTEVAQGGNAETGAAGAEAAVEGKTTAPATA